MLGGSYLNVQTQCKCERHKIQVTKQQNVRVIKRNHGQPEAVAESIVHVSLTIPKIANQVVEFDQILSTKRSQFGFLNKRVTL